MKISRIEAERVFVQSGAFIQGESAFVILSKAMPLITLANPDYVHLDTIIILLETTLASVRGMIETHRQKP